MIKEYGNWENTKAPHNSSTVKTKKETESELGGILYSLFREICTFKDQVPFEVFFKFIESITDTELCKHENNQTKKHHFTQSWRGNSTQFV